METRFVAGTEQSDDRTVVLHVDNLLRIFAGSSHLRAPGDLRNRKLYKNTIISVICKKPARVVPRHRPLFPPATPALKKNPAPTLRDRTSQLLFYYDKNFFRYNHPGNAAPEGGLRVRRVGIRAVRPRSTRAELPARRCVTRAPCPACRGRTCCRRPLRRQRSSHGPSPPLRPAR